MFDQVVRQYLVTAGGSARVELAEFTLRPDLCTPEMSAEKLMMIDFAEGWTHLGAGLGGNRFELVCVGVAVPSCGHHGVAPFDRIRAALKALPSGVPPAFDGTAARPRTTEPKRRWWKRRG